MRRISFSSKFILGTMNTPRKTRWGIGSYKPEDNPDPAYEYLPQHSDWHRNPPLEGGVPVFDHGAIKHGNHVVSVDAQTWFNEYCEDNDIDIDE